MIGNPSMMSYLQIMGLFPPDSFHPREIDIPRKVVRTYAEFAEYVDDRIRNRKPGYVSLYEIDGSYEYFSRGYIDIDLPEPPETMDEVKRRGEELVGLISRKVSKAVVVYTGGRGYNIVFSLDVDTRRWGEIPFGRIFNFGIPFINLLYKNVERIVEELSGMENLSLMSFMIWLMRVFETSPIFYRALMNRMAEYFLKGSEYFDYVDRQSLGDLRRMVRIPYTMGKRRESFIVGETNVTLYESEFTDFLQVVEGAIRDSAGPFAEAVYRKAEESRMDKEMGGLTGFPPCIVHIVETMAETGEMSHFGRFQLAAYLHSIGWSVDDIVDVFRVASDFDERVTRYQVEHIVRNNYLPAGCGRTMTMGLCPYVCNLFPRKSLGGVRYEAK